MTPEERQKIINNNRALREIKNNLELLLENDVLNDDAYEIITQALPAETSLRSGTSRVASPAINTPTTSQATPPPPVQALAALTVAHDPAPAYTSVPSPNLPPRGPPPAKAEIARARALYRYAEPNDCNFEPGDEIAVLEYMNNEWWLGRNLRTGVEGVFPVNYVTVVNPMMTNANGYPNEKQAYGGMAPQPMYQQGGYGGAPAFQQAHTPNPYDTGVPPMAVAAAPSQQQVEEKPVGGKAGEMGKKFGRRLGNAAVFGAGATIGSNIVNSIF